MRTLFTTTRITLTALLLATTAIPTIAQNTTFELTPQLQTALQKYDFVREYSDGLVAVLKVDANANDKWGFVNTQGEEVIKCQYDKVSNFQNGIANVTLNGKHGIINIKGEEIVSCRYDYDIDLNNDFAIVSINNLLGVIDKTGNEVIPCNYDYVWDFKDNWAMVEKYEKVGLVDINGKEVVPCDYDVVKVLDENWAKVKLNGKIGLFNISKKELIIPCNYDNVYSYSEGLAKVQSYGKYGMVNSSGAEIVPCEYDVVKKINDNLIVVKSNEKFGFFNTAGKQISECQYDQACTFHDGFARVSKDKRNDNKYGYIDSKGVEIVPCRYDYATDFNNGIAKVGIREKKEGYYTNTKYNFINSQGNVIVPWDKYDDIGKDVDGFIFVKSNDKYGFINTNGQEVVPCKYEAQRLNFEDGLACVKYNGKWGFINNHGEEVIPCTLDYAYRFHDGVADIISKGKCETIDITGNLISSKEISLSDVYWLSGQWGTGEEVKNPLYLNINNNDNEKNTVSFFEKGKEIVEDAQLIYNSNDNCYILKCTKKGQKDTDYIIDMDKMELKEMNSNLTLTSYDPYYIPGMDISVTVYEPAVLDKSIDYDNENNYLGEYEYMEKPIKYRTERKPEYEEVFKYVDHMPSFPGGEAALIKYVNGNIRYPKVAQENGVEGKVLVQFVVEKDGKVGEVKVARGVDKDLDREAVRVCKMLPHFNPGRNAEGDPVGVWYTMPITFKLQGVEYNEDSSEGEIYNQ